MKRHRDPEFQARIDINRTEAMRVIADIRKGSVSEHDIDMLQNFIQNCLALMYVQGPKNWAMAKFNAEMMHFVHDSVPKIEQPADCADPASGQQ